MLDATHPARPLEPAPSPAAVIAGVEVEPGLNTIRVEGANFFKFKGHAERAQEVVVSPPPDSTLLVDILLNEQHLTNPGLSQRAPTSIEVTMNGTYGASGLFGTYEFNRTATPNVWASNSFPQLVVEFEEAEPGARYKMRFLQSGPTAFTDTTITLTDDAVDHVRGTRVWTEEELVDYSLHTVAPGNTWNFGGTGRDEFKPLLIELVGPAELVGELPTMTVGGRAYRTVSWSANGETRYFAASVSAEAPRAFFALPTAQELQQNYEDFRQQADRMGIAWFLWGYSVGLWDGVVVTLFDGAVDLATFAIENSQLGMLIEWADLGFAGMVEVRRERMNKLFSGLESAGRLAWEVQQETNGIISRLQYDYDGEIARMGNEARAALALAAPILAELKDYLADLDDYEAGKLQGQILGTAVQIIISIPCTGGESAGAIMAARLNALRLAIWNSPRFARLRALLGTEIVIARFGAAGRVANLADEIGPSKMGEFLASVFYERLAQRPPLPSGARDLLGALDETVDVATDAKRRRWIADNEGVPEPTTRPTNGWPWDLTRDEKASLLTEIGWKNFLRTTRLTTLAD